MDKLFVAIASYRDRECQWTIKDLLESARYPDRINVGVCWQFDADLDQDCFQVPAPRPAQVKVINVNLADARGACWAKAQALSLLSDEQYILLIDSHMRFAPAWDVEMLEMLNKTGNPRAFLSTYPAGYEPPNKRRYSTPRLAPVKFFDRVMSQDSLLLSMERPMPSYLVAGGYLFGRRAMFDEVPYDPHLYFIGEEITHAARFFTHGWDGYTPDKCLIHHYYSRTSASKHWQDEKESWARLNSASYKRVRHILGIERTSDQDALKDIERFGLGDVRTLDAFQAAIGVNFNAMLIDRKRHESIANIEAAVARPSPPMAAHEMASLGVYACRHGNFLLPKRDAYIGRSLREYGEWTEGLNRLFTRLFQAGDTVLEVGAGFGARTIPLARLAGGEGRVIAVEQSWRLINLLHANLGLNAVDCVSVIHGRAAKSMGAVQIVEPVFDMDGNFGLVAHRQAEGGQMPHVQALALDQQNLGHIDCMIIDTPGCTSEVLDGSQQLVASGRPVVVANADNAGDAERLSEILKAMGYRLWRYQCPFFNSGNYFGKQENVFGGLVSLCLVALPDERSLAEFDAVLLK